MPDQEKDVKRNFTFALKNRLQGRFLFILLKYLLTIKF